MIVTTLTAAFLTGFLFSFNPLTFASIPMMLAYVTKSTSRHNGFKMGLFFVFGFILTHIVLGIGAAVGGEWVKSALGRHWGLFLGPLLIIMGLSWPGWIRINLPWFGVRGWQVQTLSGAFLLGIPFSVAICPFCTPALMATLSASANEGSVAYGIALLGLFALGRSIPILIGAWSFEKLDSMVILTHHQKKLEVVAGLIMIILGFYLINEYYLFYIF